MNVNVVVEMYRCISPLITDFKTGRIFPQDLACLFNTWPWEKPSQPYQQFSLNSSWSVDAMIWALWVCMVKSNTSNWAKYINSIYILIKCIFFAYLNWEFNCSSAHCCHHVHTIKIRSLSGSCGLQELSYNNRNLLQQMLSIITHMQVAVQV